MTRYAVLFESDSTQNEASLYLTVQRHSKDTETKTVFETRAHAVRRMGSSVGVEAPCRGSIRVVAPTRERFGAPQNASPARSPDVAVDEVREGED